MEMNNIRSTDSYTKFSSFREKNLFLSKDKRVMCMSTGERNGEFFEGFVVNSTDLSYKVGDKIACLQMAMFDLVVI
jgi:hypothetical protein